MKTRQLFRLLVGLCGGSGAMIALDAGSAPQVSAVRTGDEITLTWESVPGRVYRVESSECVSQDWEWATPEPVFSNGSTVSKTFPAELGTRLFRIAVVFDPVASSLVWIPPGTYMSGTPLTEVGREADEGPQTRVTITRGFYMGRYEVTQREYLEVMGVNPSFFNGIRDWPRPGVDYGINLERPVEQVSWQDAMAYCAALTARERAAGRIGSDQHYRLPTEAEWEYACRAGTTTRFSFGDDPDYSRLRDNGWFNGNSGGQTQPVGQKLPNPWGLYDMYGNVWEWCSDWYGPYPGGEVVDPLGPTSGALRVLRGGTWAWDPVQCRSGNRDTPRDPSYDFGFRVVLVNS